MKRSRIVSGILSLAILTFSTSGVFAQVKADGKIVPPAKPDKIIFAVVNDGLSVAPIAFVESGMLINTVGGDAEPELLKNFSTMYYAPKTNYELIFAGVPAGKVEIKANDPSAECAKNMADVAVTSAKAKLKGFVMGLATNIPQKAGATGVRRQPTPAEKTEVEKLIRAEFTKHKIAAAAQTQLRFHNLTAVDTNKDGKVELVGSYYVSPSANERALVFFIAELNSAGKYVFGYSEYNRYAQKDVMSQDIKDLDTGTYHELFLDMLDTNNDGKNEIFTITQSFEGDGYTVYKQNAGKWVKTLETSNYRCAY